MKRHSKLLSLAFSILMILSLVQTVALADGTGDSVDTPITIKPKNVSGEYIPMREVIYRATELEYVGEGRLQEGDVFADVVYTGERRYAGEATSAIASYKIMRGDEDVTSLYTNIVLQTGKIEVSLFGLPVPYEEFSVRTSSTLSIADIESLLGIDMADYSTPVFSGDGSFSVETGYQAPAAAGTALLVFSQPERDVNGDGIADIGMNMIELYITVRDAITVGTAGEYTTLQEAIDAAVPGDVILLQEDVTERVSISKTLTLDLNGKVLNGTATSDNTEIIALRAVAGNVTIQNGTINGRVNAYDDTVLTIAADATIQNTSLNGNQCIGILVWGEGTYGEPDCMTPTLKLYGTVKLLGGADTEGFAIGTNGTDRSKPQILVYEGAVIESPDIAFYQPCGSVTIYGGSLTGATALYYKAGDLDIRGGTFVGNGPEVLYSSSNSGATATGDALVLESCGYPAGIGKISVSGGTFKSVNGYPLITFVKDETYPRITRFISGGTFQGDRFYGFEWGYAQALIVDGFREYENDDWSYTVKERQAVAKIGSTVYNSLQKAIDAAKNGDVIVLIEEDDECPDSVIVPEGLEITIDLNGREIVFDGTAEITNYGKLTLMDSSEDYEGEVWHVVNAGGWSGAEHRKFLCRASNR